MILLLGFMGGAATIAAFWIASDWKSTKRVHAEYLREWQRANNGCAVIRSRHRRAEKHKGAPLPIDMYQVQLETSGRCRGKRINGRWC